MAWTKVSVTFFVCGLFFFGADQRGVAQLPTPVFRPPVGSGSTLPDGCGSYNSYAKPSNVEASGIGSVFWLVIRGDVP